MRTPLRVLLAVAAVLCAVQPATATPSAQARGYVMRSFQLSQSVEWDRMEVSFEHQRGYAAAGTYGGGVSGEGFRACVYARAGSVYYYACGVPTGLTFDVPVGSASGRVKFTLRDTWRGGTAVVDLTLTESGTPSVAYEVAPYGSNLGPAVLTNRLATAKGTVRITGRVGKRAVTKSVAVASTPFHFVDRVGTGVSASV